MRFSPAMRNTVLQATTICTLSLVYTHYVGENMFDVVTQNEAFSHLAELWVNETTTARAHGEHLEKMQKSVIPKDEADNYVMRTFNETNGTTWTYFVPKNETEAIDTPKDNIKESFYGRELPREAFICFILTMLQYWWLIGLEKILPARPRRRDVPYQGKDKVEESEDREEEVVKKWIAQGKVNRASLNFCNTFLKWVLDSTVGMLWLFTVQHVLRQLLRLNSPMSIFSGLQSHLMFSFLGVFLSVTPLVRLLAFVVVPAYKQILFIQFIQSVWAVFTTQFLRLIAGWAVNTEFMQEMMVNMTAEYEKDPQKHRAWERNGREL